MSKHRKTSTMQEFEQYAQLLNEIKELHFELMELLSGDVPKNVYHDGWDKMNDGETVLRSDLEDRMFEEHQNKADIHVFYGDKK